MKITLRSQVSYIILKAIRENDPVPKYTEVCNMLPGKNKNSVKTTYFRFKRDMRESGLDPVGRSLGEEAVEVSPLLVTMFIMSVILLAVVIYQIMKN